MKKVSHQEQQKAWDDEHKEPQVLHRMDSEDASSGVEKFLQFLQEKNIPHEKGIEMGCGKGRNAIWLAKKGVQMTGFDFSPAAIALSKQRAEAADVHASFQVADATHTWPFADEIFDIGIDCFASTDIESAEGRAFALSEMRRVLKPAGYLMSYMHAAGGEFHRKVTATAPGADKNSFIRGKGKYEKIFDESEARDLFKDFDVVQWDTIDKLTPFEGKEYRNKHYWVVLRKPH